jgi:hypothetical protein
VRATTRRSITSRAGLALATVAVPMTLRALGATAATWVIGARFIASAFTCTMLCCTGVAEAKVLPATAVKPPRARRFT